MASSSERSSLILDDPQASTSSSEWLIENTVETLGRMMIGCSDFNKKNEEKVAKEEEEKQKEMPSTSEQNKPCENGETRNNLRLSRIRWSPYVVPKKRKVRTKTQEVDVAALAKVRWDCDEDVGYMKFSLLDEKRSLSCGVEAARPPTPDGDVDELTEYFSHFVRVEMKMSALAESMYC